MKKTIIVGLLAVMALILTSCAGIIGFRIPGTDKVAKTERDRNLSPVVFEDFESGVVTGAYSYANTGGKASAGKFVATTEQVHGGRYCAVADFDTGISSEWGCGIAIGATAGYVDATGRDMLEAWVYAPEGTTFYFFLNEAAINGADGEYYNSSDQTGSGEWVKYEVPLDVFFKNVYSGVQAGNNDLDTSGIGTLGVQFGGNQGKGKIYVDDISLVMEK